MFSEKLREGGGVLFGATSAGDSQPFSWCSAQSPASLRGAPLGKGLPLGKGRSISRGWPPPSIQGFWEGERVDLGEAPGRGQSPLPSCSRSSYGRVAPGVMGRGRSTSEGRVLPRSQGSREGDGVLLGATSAAESRHSPWRLAQSPAALRGASWERDGVVWGGGRLGDSHHLLRAAGRATAALSWEGDGVFPGGGRRRRSRGLGKGTEFCSQWVREGDSYRFRCSREWERGGGRPEKGSFGTGRDTPQSCADGSRFKGRWQHVECG